MRKILLIIALLSPSLAPAQSTATGNYTITGTYSLNAANSVGPPTLNYDWLAYNTVCSSTPCAHDIVASNDGTNATSGDRLTYGATSGLNSTPGLTGNGSTTFFNLATTIPSTTTQYSGFAVFNLSGSVGRALIGGNTGALVFDLSSSGKFVFIDQGTGTVATCTSTYSTGTWYVVAWTFNTSTKAYACYDVSGGSYAASGSGTATAETYTAGQSLLFATGTGSSGPFDGVVSEVGLATGTIWGSTQLNQLATYIQATYAH